MITVRNFLLVYYHTQEEAPWPLNLEKRENDKYFNNSK